MSAIRQLLEALVDRPEQGTVKDWVCSWLEATLQAVAKMGHFLPGFFVGADPAQPRGVLTGKIRSRGNIYSVRVYLQAMTDSKGSSEIRVSLGGSKAGKLTFKQSFSGDTFPSAVAVAVADFLKQSKPKLDAASQAPTEELKKKALGQKNLLT